MSGWAKRFYRYGLPAVLKREDGGTIQGRGLVVPWGKEKKRLWESEGHPLGELPLPLFVFVGWLEEAKEGQVLLWEENEYRVLRSHLLALGKDSCGRWALLEQMTGGEGA